MFKVIRIAIFALPLLALAGCHKEGPAEQAGKSIDNAGQSIKDAIDPPGPAQKAGRAVDKATTD
ncbi:MAG TPA: hypothetical protein VNT30_13505 [Stellaceae bacterium]|nr:hypothetical protein [Stellaceae bacterium]